MRDPRINPRPGDVIKQKGTGYELRVTFVGTNGWVSWQRKQRGHWIEENSWSLSGWRNTVAKDAEILTRSNTAQKEAQSD